MSKLIVRRLVVVLALSALLGSPATSLAGSRSSAATTRQARAQVAPQGLLSRVWNSLVSVWEKEGCSAVLYSRCLTITPSETADASCSADPYGHCLPGQ